MQATASMPFSRRNERMVRPCKGHTAFITQSGTYGCSFLEAFEHIGISRMISYGNRVDVDEADMIAYLARDPDTKVLAAYVEGLGDGRKFIQTSREVISTYKKPIVVYKSGRTNRVGQGGPVTHRGLRRHLWYLPWGHSNRQVSYRVDSFEELLAVTKALAMQPPCRRPGYIDDQQWGQALWSMPSTCLAGTSSKSLRFSMKPSKRWRLNIRHFTSAKIQWM